MNISLKHISVFAFALAILLGISMNSKATTYYTAANGTPSTVANWWTATYGVQNVNNNSIVAAFAWNSASGVITLFISTASTNNNNVTVKTQLEKLGYQFTPQLYTEIIKTTIDGDIIPKLDLVLTNIKD